MKSTARSAKAAWRRLPGAGHAAAPYRRAESGRRAVHGSRGGRGAPPRHRPSRPEAGEHPGNEIGHQAARLRPREDRFGARVRKELAPEILARLALERLAVGTATASAQRR